MATTTVTTYTNGVLVDSQTVELPDGQARDQNQRVFIADEIMIKALAAYNNWAALTTTQKDGILKALVRYVLFKERVV